MLNILYLLHFLEFLYLIDYYIEKINNKITIYYKIAMQGDPLYYYF